MCCLVLKILLAASLEDSNHFSGQADTVILYRNIVTIKPFSHRKLFCVQREVMEEVGLKVKNIRYYKSQPWSFSSTLLCGFFCEVDGDTDITLDTEELAVGEWFDRDNIPVEDDGVSLTREMIGVFKTGGEKNL